MMNKMGKAVFAALFVVMLLLPMFALAEGDSGMPMVAKIGSTEYGSLSEAVKEANNSETGAEIVLLMDTTLGEKLTISKNVTISGNYTITREDNYTGTLFEVNTGAELKLTGGLTIDGGNNWTFLKDEYDVALQNSTNHQDFAFAESEAGAPVATDDLITVNGSVVMEKATIRNHMGKSDRNVFGMNASSSVTLNNGAKITHCATSYHGVVTVLAAGSTLTINEGAEISGNYAGRNGGIARNNNGTITMNGGSISDNYAVDTNGSVFMLYGSDAWFYMNGGIISGNSSTNGPHNGRNSAIYLHTGSHMEMSDGKISGNTGTSYGGIDAPYTAEAGNASTLEITGGEVLENISVIGNANADINGGNGVTISAGTFTQDVSRWCTPGVAAFEEDGDTYVVGPGSKIFYYAVELDENGYIASKTQIHMDTVKGSSGKVNPYIAEDKAANLAIYDWYKIEEKQADAATTYEVPSEKKFDFSQKLNAEDVYLCGFWGPIRSGLAASPDLPQTGDNSQLLFFAALLALSGAGLMLIKKRGMSR